jgi:hypothetical protein
LDLSVAMGVHRDYQRPPVVARRNDYQAAVRLEPLRRELQVAPVEAETANWVTLGSRHLWRVV